MVRERNARSATPAAPPLEGARAGVAAAKMADMDTISDATLDALVAQVMYFEHEPQDRADALAALIDFFATDVRAAERLVESQARVKERDEIKHPLRHRIRNGVVPTPVNWEHIRSLNAARPDSENEFQAHDPMCAPVGQANSDSAAPLLSPFKRLVQQARQIVVGRRH